MILKPMVDMATDDDVARFYALQFPRGWMGKVIRKGRLVAGFGGLIECENGDWVAVLEVPAHLRVPSLFRHAMRLLRDAKDQGVARIIATCDPEITRSEEFMRKLGFVPTEEEIDGKVIWQWRG